MQTASTHFPLEELRDGIAQCMCAHRHSLRKKLASLSEAHKRNTLVDGELVRLIERIESSVKKAQTRQQNVPAITYNEQLPIADRRDEIAKVINEHQVVVLAGETGSGKTTQLPKICLDIGRGIFGQIGHTQPRRIAARTVADRIADELDVTLGQAVGYQVRFHEQANEASLIKLMTDGILLAEIQSDPYLNKYDTLIIDEAHERSLNIDFILGYIKQLLPKRRDLKVIITSATIDLERFSAHFDGAPIIEVSGRTYPVELRYRPWQEEATDVSDAVLTTLEEIQTEAAGSAGDILVFLSGEREIREVSHAIKKAQLKHLEVLPLYARLSLSEQQRVFQNHKGRRVVLATNVAETSLTVPGIRYVIDTGRARISRYSLRTKVQRLPIEAISQASANQRMGRCGRVSNGVCYRLYSEDDFASRPEFTDAELLRTNLAAVVLQMLNLKMGNVEDFPFVDKPDARLINDGYKLLAELGAVDSNTKITRLGKDVSKISVDPRFSRMLIEASRLGCLNELLIIVAALTVQDPRDRPVDKRQASDEKHRRFWDENSDFIAYINLWNYVENQRQALSQNQFRKLCKSEFLNYLRLKEWRELHHQLKLQSKDLGLNLNSQPSHYDAIHKAILVGLLTNIGKKNDEEAARDYLGTRSRKFLVFPGSSLKKKKLPWLIAAEFIETNQLFAHCVAKIDHRWVLDAAEHLLKRNYFEPHYDVRSGSVKCYAKISLWGLVLVEKQRTDYANVDPDVAREVFIRSALVEGHYRGKGEFFKHNTQRVEEISTLEAKARRRDILVDDQQIFDFYNARVAKNIVNLAGFEHWRKKAESSNAELLYLNADQLMLHGADRITEEQFPNHIRNGELAFPVRYVFEPTGENDGVNVIVPVDLLHQVEAAPLEWLVPGLLREKCIALIKTLPKTKRRNLVPVPDHVDRILGELVSKKNASLNQSLGDVLSRQAGVTIDAADWQMDKLDTFYFANIVLVDAVEKIIDQGRDLAALRAKYKAKVQTTLQQIGNDVERQGLLKWDFDRVPASVDLDRGAVKVKAYPALVRKKNNADIQLFDNPNEARVAHVKGTCQLALNELGQTAKYARKQLLTGKDIGLALVSIGTREQVANDILLATIRRACFSSERDQFIESKDVFMQCIGTGKADIVAMATEYEQILVKCLAEILSIKKRVKSSKNALALALPFGDVQKQLDAIFQPGFIFDTPWRWFEQLPRYLGAANQRLEKVAQKPRADQVSADIVAEAWARHEERLKQRGEAEYLLDDNWQQYRWMIEELRVSLFAQTLKTLMPVSEKRLKKQWALLG